jgi:Zn-dependent protease
MDQGKAARAGFSIGRLFGAPVVVHWSSVVVMALLTLRSSDPGASGLPTADGLRLGLAVTFILFASLFLHEVAHAALGTALRRPVQEIAITLFGAHTAFTRPADSALASGLVAAIGPATNAAIAGFVASLGLVVPGLGSTPLFHFVVTCNLLLAGFNALPGYPLDGGRVVEAVVWAVSRRRRVGTIVAAWCGIAVALATFVYFAAELLRNPVRGEGDFLWAALISGMIGASSVTTLRDLRAVRLAEGFRLADFVHPAVALPDDATVAEAVEKALQAGAEEIFILSLRHRVTGYVSLASALRVPEDRRDHKSLYYVVDPVPEGAEVEASIAGGELLAAARYWRSKVNMLAVMDDGVVVGALVLAEVGKRLK